MNRLGILLCGFLFGLAIFQPAQGQAGPATMPDIDFGKPAKYPTLITPLVETGDLRDGHHGQPLSVEIFDFNPATHEITIAKDSLRKYGNTRIDSAVYAQDLNVFDLRTSNHDAIGKIVLTSASKKIVISPNYIVSPMTDEPAKIDPATFCAFVQFAKGDECNKPGTTVTVHRNDDNPADAADALYSKIQRKTDVVTWSVEKGGAVVKGGSFGFPVVATDQGLVKYVIQLP